jgi:hypothetical protein
MKTNLIPIVAILAIALNTQAGSLKMPVAPNLTRNGGQTLPISFTGSGWPAGQLGQVWLVNRQTWQRTLVWIDQPIVNGVNNLNLAIPWNWDQPGRYSVDVVAGNTHATSIQAYTIRSAIIYPWGGVQWHQGAIVTMTWVTDGIYADFFDLRLRSEATGEDFLILNDMVTPEPLAGRYEFNVPTVPPGTYRIWIDGYITEVEWDEADNGYYYNTDLIQQVKSERITVQ